MLDQFWSSLKSGADIRGTPLYSDNDAIRYVRLPDRLSDQW